MPALDGLQYLAGAAVFMALVLVALWLIGRWMGGRDSKHELLVLILFIGAAAVLLVALLFIEEEFL